MRFVIAIVLFVAAFFAIGFGIAQRTVLAGPDSFSTEVTTGTAPITVVEGAALNALPGTQTVTVDGQTATSSSPTAAPATCSPGSTTCPTTT